MTTTIDRALSKAEARAAEVLRCDWCLYAVTSPSLSYDTGDTPPEKLIPVTCRWCGWHVVYGVEGLGAREVEALRVYLTAGAEDRFRDPRVYAAEEWYPLIANGRKWLGSYRRALEAEPPVTPRRIIRATGDVRDAARKQAEAAARGREAVKTRAFAFMRRMRAEEKKRFGPHSFPLASEVRAIKSEEVRPSISRYRIGSSPSWAEQSAREASKCFRAAALCEAALWGGVLEETREALAELTPAVEAFDAERARKQAEREREEREREERWKRQQEE